jgi:hypothetical protein
MMQGGAPHTQLSRQISLELHKVQRQRRGDKRNQQQLQREFERRIMNEKRKESEFMDMDINVSRAMIENPLGNEARNFAFFNAEQDRSNIESGLDPAWYAVPKKTFNDLLLADKTAKSRNQIDGKFVRVNLREIDGTFGGKYFAVRGHDLEKFLSAELDPDTAEATLEGIVKDLRRKIQIMSRQIVDRQSTVQQYFNADPAAEVRIKDMMRKRTHPLNEKLDYKPQGGKGCDMLGTQQEQDYWVRNHGTPKKPKVISDKPAKRERAENKHHKALMVLDEKMQGICISPQQKGRRGGSYAEEMYPSTYHHMDAVNKLQRKKPIKDSETGQDLPEERVWGDMAFCTQHGGGNKDRCNSTDPAKYPLTENSTKSASTLCRWNEDGDVGSYDGVCEPRWLEGADDEVKNLYNSPNGFFLKEIEYIENHLRNQMLNYPNMTKEQKKQAKRLSRSHRVASNKSAPTRFVEVGRGYQQRR